VEPLVYKHPSFRYDFELSKKTWTPSRKAFDISNPNDNIFAMVESRFRRLSSSKEYEISKVEYYVNRELETKFRRRQKELKAIMPSQAASVYGFYCIKDVSDVDRIMNKNFMSRKGEPLEIRFTEDPSITLNYGVPHPLVMAEILPGRTNRSNYWQKGDEPYELRCKKSYESHGTFDVRRNSFEEIVIFNKDQILPC